MVLKCHINSSVFYCFVVGKLNFKEMELTDFLASLKNYKFPNIQQFAMKTLVSFESTYICEQTVSNMNINTSKYRSQHTNTNYKF